MGLFLFNFYVLFTTKLVCHRKCNQILYIFLFLLGNMKSSSEKYSHYFFNLCDKRKSPSSDRRKACWCSETEDVKIIEKLKFLINSNWFFSNNFTCSGSGLGRRQITLQRMLKWHAKKSHVTMKVVIFLRVKRLLTGWNGLDTVTVSLFLNRM